MIKLYHSPLSRSVRIYWLLEELGVPYELETVELIPPNPRPFAQKTPLGKVPVLVDGDVTMFESGAILEYVLERCGGEGLGREPGSPERAAFLQWVHFAEGTAFSGIGNIAWHVRFREDADALPQPMADYRTWVEAALDVLECELDGRDYLLAGGFSGADIMVGYTALVAKAFGIVDERYPRVEGYVSRLTKRPALRKALQA